MCGLTEFRARQQTAWATLLKLAIDPIRLRASPSSEGQARLHAAGLLLDQVAEAAVIEQLELGAAGSDEVDAGRDIGHHVVGLGSNAERTDAPWAALEARLQCKVGVVEEGGAAPDIGPDQGAVRPLELGAELERRRGGERLYRDKLWVLNSGTGELGWIEKAPKASDAKFHVLAFCPGFVRGLAFHGKYALVGLSKPRYERFEGLALDKKLAETDSEPWCGVQVIDLDSGACVHWFRIDGPVGELYDLGVVPGVVRPMALGFATNEILGLITHDPLDQEGLDWT
jgi:hypothetical protein